MIEKKSLRPILKRISVCIILITVLFFVESSVYAQKQTITPTITPTPTEETEFTNTSSAILEDIEITDPVRSDITQQSEQTVEPLKKILDSQTLGTITPFNAVKYAIRRAVDAGVPANTIVLLLLLPLVAAFIALARNVIGVRGFGIFLPAALAVAFVATGPLVGIGLFLVIVSISTIMRIILRKLKLRIQYLPRMALILWSVVVGVLGVLFLAPIFKSNALANVSIFAVLILALLAEDFTRVQLGKSARVAVALTTETLVLSLLSFLFLTSPNLQEFALLHPETMLIGVAIFDFLLGQYVGLRVLEFWRFRRLIKS
jgi:hypothetical protein